LYCQTGIQEATLSSSVSKASNSASSSFWHNTGRSPVLEIILGRRFTQAACCKLLYKPSHTSSLLCTCQPICRRQMFVLPLC